MKNIKAASRRMGLGLAGVQGKISEILWLRIGDSGEYEKYGTDLDAVASVLHECHVELPFRWNQYGFASETFSGANDISLFWGDKDGNPIRDLSAQEKKDLETAVAEM